MEPEDREARAEFYLQLLYWAFLEIRLAGWDGKSERCASIADAFHNLPALIAALGEDRDVAQEEASFLAALTAEAESGGWGNELQAWQRYALEKISAPE